jgi:hypothetical protein
VTQTCLVCANAQLRDAENVERDRHLREMARLGFLCCGLSDHRATFYGFDASCERWSPAGQDVTAKRLAWAGRTA